MDTGWLFQAKKVLKEVGLLVLRRMSKGEILLLPSTAY